MKYFRRPGQAGPTPTVGAAVPPDAAPPAAPPAAETETDFNILDSFVSTVPTEQNALDIFKGEWSSSMPERFGLVAGPVPLFKDDRLEWALEQMGDISGKSALELGPLEGGHSYMLSQAGASVLAIEAQTRAFLKCLIAKEVLGMERVSFMLGDVMAYLRAQPEHVDIVVASGILYHMEAPVEIVHLLSGMSDHLYLWTHVWDDDLMESEPNLKNRYADPEIVEYEGFTHTLHPFRYDERDLSNKAFCGGGRSHSKWISRTDLLRALEHFGWHVDAIGIDNLRHPSGPELSLVASYQR